MARSENQKLKLLYLKELFETQSDEDHILSMQNIVSYLAARGIRAERKSVYGDISCLQEFGMDIVLQKGPGGGYFLASRPFELAELKLLAGAVQASKFLSERKSVALIEKLSTLCSSYQAAQLERQVTVRDRVKSMNESVYYTVDRIHEAIARNLFEMSRLTVPILAVIYVPLCAAVGFSVPATILLMSAAGALGDAGSPASDTTLGPTSGLNADGQHDHIWDTCVPTFIAYNIPLMIAGIVGAQFL